MLAGLVAAFAIGGPLAVLLASLLGYVLAGAGLRPVEAMRRRAAAGDEQLPLPAAHDEIRRLGETLNDCSPGCGARSSASGASSPTPATSCARRSPCSRPSSRPPCAPATWARRRVRPSSPPIDECDRLAQLAEDLLVIARTAEGALPVRRETLARAAAARGRPRPLRRPRARARARTIARRGRRRDRRAPTRCGSARRSATWSTTRSGTAPATSCCARTPNRRRRRASRSPTAGRLRARHRRPRVRALRPRRPRAHPRRHRPRPRDRARDRRGARRPRDARGATVRVWLPSQGRLSGAAQDDEP